MKGRRSLSTDLSSIRNGLDESMQRRKRQHTTVKNTDSNGKIVQNIIYWSLQVEMSPMHMDGRTRSLWTLETEFCRTEEEKYKN